MKVRFEVDCTPEEARAFLGLPDVKPLQDAFMAKWQAEMTERFAKMDPEALMKTWFPASVKDWRDMQETFWAQIGKGLKGGGREGES